MMLPVHDIDMPAAELRFHRSSGRLSLDLVATIGERWRTRFERLRVPGDLDRWLATVDLPVQAATTNRDLAAIRTLRGAIEQLAIAAMDGNAFPDGAVRILNGAAARPDPFPQLVAGSAIREGRSHLAARSAIARDAVDLFGGPLARRIRECAADDCALVFVDTSRPGTRRWCSMRACGNRHKVARHRAAGGLTVRQPQEQP